MRSAPRVGRTPEVPVTLLYLLALLLTVAPYYHGLYRVAVNLAHRVSTWGSLLVLTLLLARRWAGRAPGGRRLLPLALGLLILLTARQAHRWRYGITAAYIQRYHCAEAGAEARAESPILGGIRELQVAGVGRTRLFENSSHCLFVACAEEFYGCDNTARTSE